VQVCNTEFHTNQFYSLGTVTYGQMDMMKWKRVLWIFF